MPSCSYFQASACQNWHAYSYSVLVNYWLCHRWNNGAAALKCFCLQSRPFQAYVFRSFRARKIETGSSLDGKDLAIPTQRSLLLARESRKEESCGCQYMKHWCMRLGKGKKAKKLKTSFGMRINACEVIEIHLCCSSNGLQSMEPVISGSLPMIQNEKKPLTGFRRPLYEIERGSEGLDICALWNSSKPESLLIPYSALLGLLFLGWGGAVLWERLLLLLSVLC